MFARLLSPIDLELFGLEVRLTRDFIQYVLVKLVLFRSLIVCVSVMSLVICLPVVCLIICVSVKLLDLAELFWLECLFDLALW